jgi:arylsulfatase A-like enzyme
MERRSVDRLALNIDLAPTIADLTGVETPELDGASLLPLLTETAPPWREDFLVEHYGAPPAPAVPSYCAVRSETHTYVAYATGEEELYNLVDDPFQLENRAGKPEFRDALEGMRARVRELCRPLPPRFGVLP